MNYVTYQANESDCGFVALKMLLATLNKNKSYLYLRKEKKLKGFSFSDLISIAGRYGVKLKAYKDEDRDLDFIFNKPALVLLDDSLAYNNHLVFLRKMRKGKVYFNDPSVGEVVMKEEEFKNCYSGKCLLVDSFDKRPFKEKEPQLVTLKEFLPSIMFQVLSTISILMGLYFIKSDSFVFIPFIFIIVFTISELFENWYYIRLLKAFDNNYLCNYMLLSKDHEKDFREFSEMKSLTFSKARNIITACCISFSIIFVLLFNDPTNTFVVLLILCLAAIDYFISLRLTKANKIAQDEKVVLTKTFGLELGENLLTLNTKTNKIAFNISFKKCITNCILLLLSFVMMLISKVTSTSFLLFSFASYYVLFEQAGRIMNYDSVNEAYLKKKCRFMETIEISKERENMI